MERRDAVPWSKLVDVGADAVDDSCDVVAGVSGLVVVFPLPCVVGQCGAMALQNQYSTFDTKPRVLIKFPFFGSHPRSPVYMQ